MLLTEIVIGFRLTEQISSNASLKAEVQMLTSSLHELKGLNACLRDEHTALQLAFASLEDKLRKVQVNLVKYVRCLQSSFVYYLRFRDISQK